VSQQNVKAEFKEIQYQDKNSFNEEGILEGALNLRPNSSLVFATLLAALLIYTRYWLSIVIGVILLVIVILALIVIKDYKVIEFYNDALYLINQTDHNLAYQVKYDEVSEWITDAENRKVYLTFTDGSKIEFETMRSMRAYSLFNKVMPDKKAKSFLSKLRQPKKEKKDKDDSKPQ
jgi:hypothetical protein